MACFNYMVILGELRSGETKEKNNMTTSYEDLYSSMMRVPYLGSSIPIVLPSLVIVFCGIFAILSIFKLKNKALNAFKKANESN